VKAAAAGQSQQWKQQQQRAAAEAAEAKQQGNNGSGQWRRFWQCGGNNGRRQSSGVAGDTQPPQHINSRLQEEVRALNMQAPCSLFYFIWFFMDKLFHGYIEYL